MTGDWLGTGMNPMIVRSIRELVSAGPGTRW
jgi:hypothetical protein